MTRININLAEQIEPKLENYSNETLNQIYELAEVVCWVVARILQKRNN